VVVKETEDGQQAAHDGLREVGGQQEEGGRGEGAGEPDGGQVEVWRVGQAFTTLHSAQAFPTVHCPAALPEQGRRNG